MGEQKDRRHEEDWLFSEGAAWNFREIMQLKRVLVIAFLGLIYASWHPMTLLNMANEGGVTWISSLPISISVAFGTFLVMFLFQAFSGRHAPTPFTNVSLYMALLTNAFMALLTEIGVAALTFAQRRQVVSRSGVGAMTLWESFWAMHQAGMQPYCTTLRGLFDPRHAAERTFEQRVREPGVTAAAHFLIRLTQKDCVIIATVIFAFGSGPYSQAIGVMMTSGTAPCG